MAQGEGRAGGRETPLRVLVPALYPWDSPCARKLGWIPFIWLFCDAACLQSPPLPVLAHAGLEVRGDILFPRLSFACF